MESRSRSTRSRKAVSPAAPRRRTAAASAEAPAPTHDQIALRAHELYEGSGRQSGREQEFWLEAERQLEHEARMVRT